MASAEVRNSGIREQRWWMFDSNILLCNNLRGWGWAGAADWCHQWLQSKANSSLLFDGRYRSLEIVLNKKDTEKQGC